MLKSLKLKQFKNFKDAELHLGPFTILVGTNASGKSNIRDALRFLHGIGRGYNIADIIGEKYAENGIYLWQGIRGGIKEIAFDNSQEFGLEVRLFLSNHAVNYQIELQKGKENTIPIVIKEQLDSIEELKSVTIYNYPNTPDSFKNHQPLLSQIAQRSVRYFTENVPQEQELIQDIRYLHDIGLTLQEFNSIQFLDLVPDAMRLPSFPGQTILGDRGENLSSVLLDICQDSHKKAILLEWLQELTPLDAQDFEFPTDFTGKVLLTLVEKNGQKISAYSASDGTLRFLAMIAALLSTETPKIYFFEELDNGIHPTRLHLLLQLIEQQVSQGKVQVIATTHSSQLLRLLSHESLESVSLVYRLENQPDAKIIRVLDIPDAQRILKEQNLAHLHESAWLENVMEFISDDEVHE